MEVQGVPAGSMNCNTTSNAQQSSNGQSADQVRTIRSVPMRFSMTTLHHMFDRRATSGNIPEPSRGTFRPVSTLSIVLVIWLTYLVGYFLIIDNSEEQLGLYGPLSPPIASWYFFTVTWWPDCQDVRADIWRPFSYQFVHGSLPHLLGNTLVLLCFGLALEYHLPRGRVFTMLVYQSAVVFGGLGHSLIWPYEGLIGCSPGVYGIIGACWVLMFIHKPVPVMHPALSIMLKCALIAQLAIDIALYFFFYTEGVGYIAHYTGFLGGALLLLLISGLSQRGMVSQIMAIIGTAGFVSLFVALIYCYASRWPPRPPARAALLHNNRYSSCCSQLLRGRYADIAAGSVADQSSVYCVDGQLLVDDDKA